MNTTSNVPCRKIAEELCISVSTLNMVIANRETILKQSAREHVSQKQNERAKYGKVKQNRYLWNDTERQKLALHL